MSTKSTRRAAPARKSERTREEILAAAARLLRRRGVDAATLRDIAAEAGMEAGSLYYHFGSKDALVDEVLDRGLRDIRDGVGAVLEAKRAEGAGFRETFAAAVAAHLRHLHARGDFTSTNIRNFSQLSARARARHRPLRQDYAEMWEGMLAAAQARGALRADLPVRPLRQFVLGALNWTVEWFDPARAPLDGLAAGISGLILDGIARPGADAPARPAAEGPGAAAAGPDPAAKSERSREAILRAAARLIRDRGPTAATQRAIAREAEMEAGSLYYHFRSKEEILDAVLERGLWEMREGLRAGLAEAGRGAGRRAQIARAVRIHLRRLLAMGEFTSANIRNYGRLPREVRARHRPIRVAYAALWDRLLAEAQADGVLRESLDPGTLRPLLLGALNWTVEWFDAQAAERGRAGAMSLDAYADMCVSVILDGVAADRPDVP